MGPSFDPDKLYRIAEVTPDELAKIVLSAESDDDEPIDEPHVDSDLGTHHDHVHGVHQDHDHGAGHHHHDHTVISLSEE